MTREDIVLDNNKRQRLEKALQHSTQLDTVYTFKQQLKEIWKQSSSDQKKRLQRLQDWCIAAEQSGIEALQEFALFLRGYTLLPHK